MRQCWLAIMSCSALLLSGACSTPASPPDTREPAPAPAMTEAAALAQACSGCHATPGGEGLASLDEFDATTIEAVFRQYRADEEGVTVMHRLARGYTEEEIKLIAAWLDRNRGD